MKPIHILFIFGFLFTVNANGQKWLWAREAAINSNNGWCSPEAITTDNAGNVFETGIYKNIVSFGSDTLRNSSNVWSTYLVKYDANGNALWARTSAPAGNGPSYGYSVATDASGNAYVTGNFEDTLVFGPDTLISPGIYGLFYLVKFDPNGNVLWIRSTTNTNTDCVGYGVATDSFGNVCVTGIFGDTITFGSYTLPGEGNVSFLVKFDQNGNVLWATSNSTPSLTNNGIYASAVACDAFRNIYVTGVYEGTVYIGPFTFTCIRGGVYLTKYDVNGNVVWATSPSVSIMDIGDFGNAISVDVANNIYITGNFCDTLTFGAYALTNGGAGSQRNVFLAKYSDNGNVIWAKSPNGKVDGESGSSVVADKWGNVYLGGVFDDTISFGGITLTADSTFPSYLIKFDSSGNALCGARMNHGPYLNGFKSGIGTTALAADPIAGNVYCSNIVDDFWVQLGDTSLYGNNNNSNWGFLAKWTCTQCAFTAQVNETNTICKGDSALLSASGGNSYTWAPSASINSANIANPVATPSVTTLYTVAISSGQCITKDTAKVVVHSSPVVSVCCDSIILRGSNIQLTATGASRYLWIPSTGLSCRTCSDPIASPTQNTSYYVTMRTDSGCIVTKEITIDVSCGNIFIPDAFSPNGDGQNDYLYVRGDCIKSMQFDVFDRWGNKVFETTDKNIPWDGRFNGQAANTGSYVYYLSATLYDGTTQTKKGNVTLVR